MLLVKTYIDKSKIQGIGLFANEDIKKGTKIWIFQEGFDTEHTIEQIENLSLEARRQFLKYAYLDIKSQKYILCFDDARFFNHSSNPNVYEISDSNYKHGIDIAISDIHKGDELTVDYSLFDQDFVRKIENNF